MDEVAGMAVHELLIPLPGRPLRLLEAADSNEARELNVSSRSCRRWVMGFDHVKMK